MEFPRLGNKLVLSIVAPLHIGLPTCTLYSKPRQECNVIMHAPNDGTKDTSERGAILNISN